MVNLCEDARAYVVVNWDVIEQFGLCRAVMQSDRTTLGLFVFVEDFLMWSIEVNPKLNDIKDPFG